MFFGPHTNPSDQREGENGMTHYTVFLSHFRRIQTHQELGIREHLLDGPAQREAFDDSHRRHRQVGRRQITRFAFATGILGDDDPQFDTGLGPPRLEAFDFQRHAFSIDVGLYSFPAASCVCNPLKFGQPTPVPGLPASLLASPLGRIVPETSIEAQPADERNVQLGQRFQHRFVVVSSIGNQRDWQRNPVANDSEHLDNNVQARTEYFFGTRTLGAVQRNPEWNGDGNPEQLDHYCQNDPIVAPDITWPRASHMIEETSSTEDMPAPFGTKGIVDNYQNLCQSKAFDDPLQQCFEEQLPAKLGTGKETVEAALVAFPCCAQAQAPDVPLSGLDQPWNGYCDEVWPASFGKCATTTEDDLGKFRCTLIVDHGPLLSFRELV